MVVDLTFDTASPGYQPGLGNLAWTDLWPRTFVCGGSEAYLGADMIILITRPFTPGEDAVVAWAISQDDCEMVSYYHMSDGRDFFILQRKYRLQSLQDAALEQQLHVRKMLESHGVIIGVSFER